MRLSVKGSAPVQAGMNLLRIFQWVSGKYESPSPHFIKQGVLIRNASPNATWVETGTYLGSTTKKLQKMSARVISVEPQPEFYAYNLNKFRNASNVELHHGTSENVFPDLIPTLSGNLNFWLDGHFSGGNTFKGDSDTPILKELKLISQNLDRFNDVTVFVDDVRCFAPYKPEYRQYPEVDLLVEWSNSNGLTWTIEHDIFIAKRVKNL
jgi:hypothetical protein